MEPVILRENVTCIRRFRPDDAARLFPAVRESVNELCRFMTWCHPDYSLDECDAFIARSATGWERGEQYNFAIFDAMDQTLLGSVGLNRLDRTNRSANIGYWVRRSRTQCGTATAALRLIAGFGLQELNLRRLEILVPDHNVASRRVAEKAGAKFEGLLRNRIVLGDIFHDARLFSLVPEDLDRMPDQPLMPFQSPLESSENPGRLISLNSRLLA